MVAGDLVLVQLFGRLNGAALAMSATGGQTWTSLTLHQPVGQRAARWFWCRYDGTWTADPSFAIGGAANGTAVMAVFRPTTGSNTWALDVAEVLTTGAAPTTPFDMSIAEITTLTDGAVVVAGFTCINDEDNVLQTGGWTNILSISNIAGTDSENQLVYFVDTTAGATGAVVSRQTTGVTWIGYIAAFKEASAAATMLPPNEKPLPFIPQGRSF